MTGAVIVLVLAGLLMVWITGVVAAAVPASSVSAVLLPGVVIAAVVLVAGGVRGVRAVG